MERLGDIYLIRNVETGYKHRVKEHITTAKSTSNHNNDIPKLYSAIRCANKGDFIMKRLETCPISLLDEKEKWWIRIFDCVNHGYNTYAGGSNTIVRSESIKELWKNEQYRTKQIETHTEQWKTDEYRNVYFSAIQSRERENKLPHNIYLTKKNGNIVGYEVTIKRHKQRYDKKFTSSKFSMEEKLEMALKWRDEKLAELGNNP